ncbi:unnamed protein product [Discula destructiva]
MPSSASTSLLLALVGAALSSPLANTARQAADDFSGDVQNGLVDGGCADTMVIFARGTTEQGNVGALTGPPFFEALSAQVGAGNLLVQGVEYPADVAGFLAGGDAEGSALMAQLTEQAIADCPGSKVIMSGYSQGGQLVHNAAEQLPADVTAQVAGAVIFGDPDNGEAVQGIAAAQTLVVCNNGDLICEQQAIVRLPHLIYSQDAETAADFVVGL